MRTINNIFTLAVVLALISCSTSQKVLSSWVNKEELKGKKYSKVFIAVLTQNTSSKTILEYDLSATLNENGYQTVKSIDALAGSFRDNPNLTKDDVLAKVRETNCDVILTVTLLDSKTETRYVPGTSVYASYAPYPVYGYYGGFGTYYGYYAPAMYSSGYYTTDKTYFLESNLFDADTEKILWSVQSATYNPDNIKDFSSRYCKLLVSQAKDDELLK
jgi:hypothetical protein